MRESGTNCSVVVCCKGEGQEPKIHKGVVAALGKIAGVEDIREVFESPNKYGYIMSHVSFRFDVQDKYNYSGGSLSIDYKRKMVFMPNMGYFVQGDLNVKSVIALVKENYELGG